MGKDLPRLKSNNMRKYIKYIIAVIGSFIFAYLWMAFVNFNLNPSDWNMVYRALIGTVGIVFSAFSCGVIYSESYE